MYDNFPKSAVTNVPAHYLQHTKFAIIDEQSAELLDSDQLPSLKRLRVHLCWDPEWDGILTEPCVGTTEESITSTVLGALKHKQVWSLLDSGLANGTLPALVLVETEVELYCEAREVTGCWTNIVIDLCQRKIVSSINKHVVEHEEGCKDAGKTVSEFAESDEQADEVEDAEGDAEVEHSEEAQDDET